MIEIKTCVACGSVARMGVRGRVKCKNTRCQMTGPKNDRRGEKWNKLPRREQGRAARRTPAHQRKGVVDVAEQPVEVEGGEA